jgi:DNA-binding MarR family transcriptional regulator
MKNSSIDQYLKIRNLTYHVFERDFLHYLNTLSRSELTLKDVNFLYQIKNTEPLKNTPTQLAHTSRLSLKMISKRIQELTQKNFLIKNQNPEDKRQYFIQLSNEGENALSLYQAILNNFTERLRKTFKVYELLRLIKALVYVSNQVSTLPPLKFTYLRFSQFQAITQVALSRIYEWVIQRDLTFIEDYELPFSLKDLRVLLEIHIQSSTRDISLIDLYNPLLIPLPTLSRSIQRLSDGYINKKHDLKDHRKTYLFVKASKKVVLESFMKSRLDLYKDVEKWVGKKQYEYILRAYQTVKDIANGL